MDDRIRKMREKILTSTDDAALTATDKVGAGDSHRGAVATALVEALRCDAAKNRDFGVKAKEGREFPDAAAWARMFESA